ncbi:peptidase M20 [Kipferlia bialata]|uniref:Peptidase M20 n=1 Tax=Kipferlia bialata TaxID=797122 RepID=A0A9K3D0K1_9EUKA|nr:peptidase M20 [Kipferlia bialata]|eukprot:g7787.t1
MTITDLSDVATLLQRMVQIDSVSGSVCGRDRSEQPLIDMLHRQAKDWGLHPTLLPVPGHADQLIITARPPVEGDTRPLLLFDSHTDTVGVEGMTVEPFAAEVRDGKMYGRGTCDTKGTGAAMLCALRQYAETEVQPVRVAVLFSVDEEMSMDGIQHFLTHDYEAVVGDAASVNVIVGEPSDLRLYVVHNGVLTWKLSTSGVAAHSSRPSNGVSAITPMLTLLQAVEALYIPSVTACHGLTGTAACAVTMIKGGHSPNVIADHCEATIDRRLSAGDVSETPELATAALRKVSACLKRCLGDAAGTPEGISFCTHARTSTSPCPS